MTPYVVKEWIIDRNDPSQLTGAKLSYYDNKGSDNAAFDDHKDKDNAAVDDHKDKEQIDISIDGAFVMIGATPITKWTKIICIRSLYLSIIINS